MTPSPKEQYSVTFWVSCFSKERKICNRMFHFQKTFIFWWFFAKASHWLRVPPQQCFFFPGKLVQNCIGNLHQKNILLQIPNCVFGHIWSPPKKEFARFRHVSTVRQVLSRSNSMFSRGLTMIPPWVQVHPTWRFVCEREKTLIVRKNLVKPQSGDWWFLE
jgi:hypothetical protein